MKTGLTSPMIDGFTGGMKVIEIGSTGMSTEISRGDYEYIHKAILKTANGTEREGNCWTVLKLDEVDGVRVECNERRGRFFLNVSGNPISFLTGQNMIGTCDLPLLANNLYRGVAKALKKQVAGFSMPQTIRTAVEELNVSVNGLAFAMYTPELELKDWTKMKFVLLALDYIYSTRIYGTEQAIKDYLGLRVSKQGDYSLLIEKRVGAQKYWTVRLYNKHVETTEKAQSIGYKQTLQSDWLKNRLRIDLTLYSGFFHRNRLTTMRRIHEVHGKDYAGWAIELARRALDQDARMSYLLAFNVRINHLDKGEYGDWLEDYLNEKADPPTPMCKAWFERQGIDVTLPMGVHTGAALALNMFSLDTRMNRANLLMNRAVLGDSNALRSISKLFRDGIENPSIAPLLKRSALLRPDEGFSRFKVDRGRLVDMETGEIVK